MKKAIIVVAVLALTMVSSVALADITISGSVDFRGWAENNKDFNDKSAVNDANRFNQSRVSLTADGKMGDAKAKLTIWQDWENWGGGREVANGTSLGIKEAWADFPLFGIFRAKGGHMPLMLGNGWFHRDMYRGDDAWVVYGDAGGAHFGFVNIKLAEASPDDDADIYALVFTQKAGDTVFGANLARIVFAKPDGAAGSNILNNIGLHATIAAGPAKINAEFDFQMGKNKQVSITPASGIAANPEYKGNQLVVTGALPMGPATLNFTVARGTGNKTPVDNDNNPATAPVASSTDYDQVQTFLDITNKPGHTFVYDYRVKTATGALNTGFANTTALGVGADMKFGKIGFGAGFFYLKATEKVCLNNAKDINGNSIFSDDLGMEIDAKVTVPMAEGVTWTTFMGYFMPGDAYKITRAGVATDPDEVTSIMTVLSAAIK